MGEGKIQYWAKEMCLEIRRLPPQQSNKFDINLPIDHLITFCDFLHGSLVVSDTYQTSECNTANTVAWCAHLTIDLETSTHTGIIERCQCTMVIPAIVEGGDVIFTTAFTWRCRQCRNSRHTQWDRHRTYRKRKTAEHRSFLSLFAVAPIGILFKKPSCLIRTNCSMQINYQRLQYICDGKIKEYCTCIPVSCTYVYRYYCMYTGIRGRIPPASTGVCWDCFLLYLSRVYRTSVFIFYIPVSSNVTWYRYSSAIKFFTYDTRRTPSPSTHFPTPSSSPSWNVWEEIQSVSDLSLKTCGSGHSRSPMFEQAALMTRRL